MVNIGVNEFIKRHTKESCFSHYDGSFEELVNLVKNNFKNKELGYKDGVLLVNVPPDKFYTSMVKVTDNTELECVFSSRREYEEPYIKSISKNSCKSKAKYVKIVLYSNEVLKENDENSTNCDWEIISINASIYENHPMNPITMARNMLNKKGGSSAEYTAEEFAESIWFWKDHVMCKGDD